MSQIYTGVTAMTIGEQVKAWRLKECLSLKEAAEKVGCDHSTLSLIERGIHRPHYKTRRGLAKAMGLTPEELQQ